MKPTVSVTNLTVSYRTGFFSCRKTVLKNISFKLKPGTLVGLIGNNGAGKSTLLKAICELVPKESGTIQLNKNKIGYLPERFIGPGFLTAKQFLWYTGRVCNLDTKKLKKKIEQLLEQFNLVEYKNAKLNTLSKGTAQRLYLAQTALDNPTLFILDEPLSGLDTHSKNIVLSFLKEQKKAGKTLICSTHTDELEIFDAIISVEDTFLSTKNL